MMGMALSWGSWNGGAGAAERKSEGREALAHARMMLDEVSGGLQVWCMDALHKIFTGTDAPQVRLFFSFSFLSIYRL